MNRAIANIVRDRRTELGLTQEQAATKSPGISSATLRAIELGTATHLRPRTTAALCKVLELPPYAFDALASEASLQDLHRLFRIGDALYLARVAESPSVARHALSEVRRIEDELSMGFQWPSAADGLDVGLAFDDRDGDKEDLRPSRDELVERVSELEILTAELEWRIASLEDQPEAPVRNVALKRYPRRAEGSGTGSSPTTERPPSDKDFAALAADAMPRRRPV